MVCHLRRPHVKISKDVVLSHTPDRCSEMCYFIRSDIVVRSWSKLGLSALFKGTWTDFSPCLLGHSNQRPYGYWPNTLRPRLPAPIKMGASSIEDPYLTNTKIASFPTWKTPDARVGVPLMSVMRQPSLQYLRKTTTQLSFDAILKRQAFIAQLLG